MFSFCYSNNFIKFYNKFNAFLKQFDKLWYLNWKTKNLAKCTFYQIIKQI